MQALNERKYLPDADHLGILTSTILLAYALSRLVQTPDFNIEVQLPGFFLLLPLNMSTAMTLVTAGLTATGMDWLLRSHPSLNHRPTFQWWIFPTLGNSGHHRSPERFLSVSSLILGGKVTDIIQNESAKAWRSCWR